MNWDWIILILGTAFALWWRGMDMYITLKAKRLKIGHERTSIVATDGQLSIWKASVVILGIIAASWVAFFYMTETRWACGLVAAVGGLASMGAYYGNKKNIRNRLAKRARDAGGPIV